MHEDVRDLVLLIDDDFSVRKMHAKVLSRAGFAIEAASGGAEALGLLEKGLGVGAIVTDLHMPGIDGLTFVRAVRKLDFDVPVIIVTGYPSLESAMRVIEYGGFRYLTKPAPAAELVSAIRSAVSMHRLALLKRRALELYESERWHFPEIAQLTAQMALEGDVKTKTGAIVVPGGKQLILLLLERLVRFSRAGVLIEPVRVRIPVSAN